MLNSLTQLFLKATLASCITEGEPICNDISIPNSDVKHSKGCDRKNGIVAIDCRVVITCQKGYYPSDPAAVATGAQTLVCKGYKKQWTDVGTSAENQSPIACLSGCVFNKTLDTAVYDGKVPADKDIITFKGVPYVPVETTVTVKCKPGMIAKNERERASPAIKLVCKDGKWYNPATGEDGTGPGEVCVGTCDPIQNIPPSVAQITVGVSIEVIYLNLYFKNF